MFNPPLFEIIVGFPTWREAIMPLLTHPDLVATGPVFRDPGRRPTGLLVHQLISHGSNRTGANFPPLGDWVAVAAPVNASLLEPGPWIRRLGPLSAQLLGILLVGFGREQGQWCGWTVERGVVRPLAGLRIVGPGMVLANGALPGAQQVESPNGRWSRLRGALGDGVLAKLRQVRAAVIGCSRTGTLTAGMLAALGVRGLVLVDGDVIERHNLDGMSLSTETDVGENKAVALGRRLVKYRPDLLVLAVRRPLDALVTEEVLGGIDLLATCVDQDGGRLRAAHWARQHLVVHLDIGTGVRRLAEGGRQLAADVRLLLPGAGCVSCVGGVGDAGQAAYDFLAPPGALPRRPPERWDARGRLGSLITLNCLAVSVGLQSWLDLLEGSLANSIWHRLRWRPGPGLEVNSALVNSAADCSLCRAARYSAGGAALG
jgi:hypothetical protein